jgi:hypothetical protein
VVEAAPLRSDTARYGGTSLPALKITNLLILTHWRKKKIQESGTPFGQTPGLQEAFKVQL